MEFCIKHIKTKVCTVYLSVWGNGGRSERIRYGLLEENVLFLAGRVYNNIFLIREVHCHNCVLKDCCLNFTFCTPSYTFKFSIPKWKKNQNHVSVFNTFNLAVNGVIQHVTNTPKISVYIEGSRKYSTKIQSLLLTKISSVENDKTSHVMCHNTWKNWYTTNLDSKQFQRSFSERNQNAFPKSTVILHWEIYPCILMRKKLFWEFLHDEKTFLGMSLKPKVKYIDDFFSI